MNAILVALSPIGLYIFSCTGTADGITEVRIQTEVLSFIQDGAFHFALVPPMKAFDGSDISWFGPAYSEEGRHLVFRVGEQTDKLTILNNWDGSTPGHAEGEFTVSDVCFRSRPN
jgi:hypothetical protein